MPSPSLKSIGAVLWLSAVSFVGIALSADSLSSWALLAVVAVVLPLIAMWWWNDPSQTMSQTIQEALR